MRILTRYLVKEFLKLALLCQFGFTAVYLLVDFLQRIDDILDAQAPAGAAALYFAYKIPLVAVQMSPIAALIAVIVLYSMLQRHNEMIALKASGVSVMRFSLPVMTAALGISLTVFLFSELVVPYATARSEAIWTKEVDKRDAQRFYGTHIWYKGPRAIYWIRHFDAENQSMADPTFYFMDADFRLVRKVYGRSAVWTGALWRVFAGGEQKRNESGEYVYQTFEELDLSLPEPPETFLTTVKRPEEMGYWELKRYAERIRSEGYDAARYLVDTQIKLALPLVGFILVLLGIPIALSRRRGGAPVAVSIGIGVSFLYLLTLGVTRSFGISGALPPFLAAWFANAVFCLIGVYLFIHTET